MTGEPTHHRTALVLGGTGAIGSAVVRMLTARGISTSFIYVECEQAARTLASESGAEGHRVDLRDAHAWQSWLDSHAASHTTSVLMHAAGRIGPRDLGACDARGLDDLHAVNLRAPLLAMRALAPVMA